MSLDFLTLADRRLAYQRQPSERPSGVQKPVGVVFLGGYGSDMAGTKANFLAEKCRESDIPFVRFDYSGHGQSSGTFMEGTIGSWLEDSCAILDQLTAGPQILVGSSMGGWLAILLALKRPIPVRALIGVAAAPDFTEELVMKALTPDQQARLESEGVIYDENASPEFRVPLTWRLVQEARQHLVMRSTIEIGCPVRLLQGLHDEEVPWKYALRLAEGLAHDDVSVTLVKEGTHRLSRPRDLELMWRTVEEFL